MPDAIVPSFSRVSRKMSKIPPESRNPVTRSVVSFLALYPPSNAHNLNVNFFLGCASRTCSMPRDVLSSNVDSDKTWLSMTLLSIASVCPGYNSLYGRRFLRFIYLNPMNMGKNHRMQVLMVNIHGVQIISSKKTSIIYNIIAWTNSRNTQKCDRTSCFVGIEVWR